MTPQRPAGQDRIAEIERRLEQLEREPGLRARSRSMMNRVVPPEAQTHFLNAGREQLLGFRSILDHWLDRLDRMEAETNPRERETIEID